RTHARGSARSDTRKPPSSSRQTGRHSPASTSARFEHSAMTKPMIRKNGDVWQVIIRDRTWNTRATFTDALTHGNRIATYARQIRIQRDIQRIQAALQRMESR